MRKFYIFLLGLYCFFNHTNLNAQQVLLQGWYWDYPKTANGYSWADTLRLKAAGLKQAGFTHIWFPPHAAASSGPNSNGYDPRDLFIGNTTTGLGTRPALNAMLNEFSSQGIDPVADVIFNHRDGGFAENNPSVKQYITQEYNASKSPFPSDRFRCILPLGGATGNGAGDYYFKIGSKTGDAMFNGKPYKIYLETKTKGYLGLPALNEGEPNGGGDCGQSNNDIFLGRDMNATVETTSGCNTDEFHLNIGTGDFNPAGDTLFIYLSNVNGNYSDHRIYGIWSGPRSMDIANEVQYQTYTNFDNMPSGRGKMDYNFFKPNTNNVTTTGLNGDWDGMYFYYDYDQFQQQTEDSLIAYAKWNWTDLGVRGFRMDAVKHFTPSFVGHLLTQLNSAGMNPSLVVGEWYDTNTGTLKSWIDNVNNNMSTAAKAAIQPKIFDFSLRENLRQACDNASFDTRNIFSGSLHDAAAVSGFNIVTFVNNHDFRDASGFASLIHNNTDLAYAYILSNNQLGVPTVFYPDYYGYPSSGPIYNPTGLPEFKPQIDLLVKALQQYINGSPSVDYLNRFGTPYSSNYISGSTDKALIYQLEGHAGNGNKDVIVAINFGSTDLKVDQQINNRGGAIITGEKFTDVLARSAFPYQVVDGSGRVYIELPAKSYSIWVQGDHEVLPLRLLQFDARQKQDVVSINWKVADNQEAESYEVQRADEHNHFRTIGTLAANDNIGDQGYQFTDQQPICNGSMLYRLKLNYKTKETAYSDVKMIRLNNCNDFTVTLLGNLVSDKLSVMISNPGDAYCSLQIFNALGQQVRYQALGYGNNIQHVVTVPVQNLSAGLYYLTVKANGEKRTLSFAKQ